MSETTVIREFLVALGFKTDESALKNFQTGIEKASKSVFALAAAVEGTAVTVAAGVARFASNLEALYFASMRTHAAAANLQALGRAAQNFGASSGEALQAVEGLARFLRNNPGGGGLLSAWLGHSVAGQDPTKTLVELGKHWANMPTYLAAQQAGQLGVSDNLMLALMNGDFEASMAKAKEAMPDLDKATNDSHEFMESLRLLEIRFQSFGIQAEDALQKKFGVNIKSINEYLRVHGPEIAQKIADIMGKVIDIADRVTPAIKMLYDAFVKLDDETGGLSTKLLVTLFVLRAMGGGAIIGGVLQLAAALVKVASGASAAGLAMAGSGVAVAAAGAGGWAIGSWLYDKFGQKALDLYDSTQSHFYDAEDYVSYLQGKGWSRDQASGIVARLMAESQLNPNATGDNGAAYGLAQWRGDRRAHLSQYLNQNGNGVTQQLDFLSDELRGSESHAGQMLRMATNAAQAYTAFTNYYERPLNPSQNAAANQRMAMSLSHQTTINVHGSDPKATAREVAREQERVNAEIVRNMTAAFQR